VLVFPFPLKNNTYRVVDGDTVEVELDRGWWSSKTVMLRLVGLDAPETFRPKSELEREAGTLVKELVYRWLKAKVDDGAQLWATSEKRPKYAKRGIGRIMVGSNGSGADLCAYLLEAGVVKAYQGKTRSWEESELQEILENAQRILNGSRGKGL
jgi:endonuclease YncB( thermonuclease family)